MLEHKGIVTSVGEGESLNARWQESGIYMVEQGTRATHADDDRLERYSVTLGAFFSYLDPLNNNNTIQI